MTKSGRVTPAEVRKLALALPGVVEGQHFDRPDFRVSGKIFATLRDEWRAVVLRTTPANLAALVSADGQAFWDEWRGRWLGVCLDQVHLEVLEDLVVDAWRLVAPKRLAAELRDE